MSHLDVVPSRKSITIVDHVALQERIALCVEIGIAAAVAPEVMNMVRRVVDMRDWNSIVSEVDAIYYETGLWLMDNHAVLDVSFAIEFVDEVTELGAWCIERSEASIATGI